MSLKGRGAQRGFQFQDYVALYYSLDLLKDRELVSVEIESTGLSEDPNSLFVDDIALRYRNGVRKFIQVKLSGKGMKDWSMKSLAQIGELQKICKQLALNSNDLVELVCPDGFSNLRELKRDTNEVHDSEGFAAHSSEAAKARMRLFCELTHVNELQAFNFIRRLSFGARHEQDEWKEHCLTKLHRYVDIPEEAFSSLLVLIKNHQCKLNNAPGILTLDVFKSTLAESSITLLPPVEKAATGSIMSWKYDGIFRRTRDPIRIVPRGTTEVQKLDSRPNGPQIYLALRPTGQKKIVSVDAMEENFHPEYNPLPTFTMGSNIQIARTKDGLCAYELWTMPASKPTGFQRFLSFFSENYVPTSSLHCISSTYLQNDGEILMSYAFRLKSGYGDDRLSQEVPIPFDVEQIFASALDSARSALRVFGVNEPFEGIASICGGVYGCAIPLVDNAGNLTGEMSSTTADIEIEKEFVVASADITSHRVLRPFYLAMWESLHTKRPAYYDNLPVLTSRSFDFV